MPETIRFTLSVYPKPRFTLAAQRQQARVLPVQKTITFTLGL